MGPVTDALAAYAQSRGWTYETDAETGAFLFEFPGETPGCVLLALPLDDAQQLVFWSVLPVEVPEQRRPAVAEFLTRANYGLYVGNFEMDWDDGEVRFKTGIDVEGAALTDALITGALRPNVAAVETYAAAFLAVVDGADTAAEAAARAEAG